MKTALLLSLFSLLPQQEPKTVALSYKDGEAFTAQVLDLQGDEVKLKVMLLGGHMQVKRKLADFSPASIFVIEMQGKKPADFDSHFAMAKRAAELGLVGQAGQEARAAVESVTDADAAAAKKTEVRTWAAGALEKMLKDAVADGRIKEAQHYLKLLTTRLSDMRSEAQLDALAGMVEALEANDREAKQQARQAKLDSKAREEIERKLKPIQKHIADGDKCQREAVVKSSSTVASSNLCEKAIDHYKAAWKALQALGEKYPDDVDLERSIASMGKQLHDNAIRAALHAANVLTVQSNYKGAMDWATKVLAYEPDNAEAKEMVRTIQIASAAASNQWGWGWHVPGGPVVDPRKK